MNWAMKRLQQRLVTVSFPDEQAQVAKAQIQDIVAYHAGIHTPHKSFMDQMEALAFDCYVQGLIDGNQLPSPAARDSPSTTKEKP